MTYIAGTATVPIPLTNSNVAYTVDPGDIGNIITTSATATTTITMCAITSDMIGKSLTIIKGSAYPVKIQMLTGVKIDNGVTAGYVQNTTPKIHDRITLTIISATLIHNAGMLGVWTVH